MATGKKRKRSAQKALVLDNAAVAGSSDESATKKPRQASSLEASSNTTRAPLVAESGVSSVAADAEPNSKAARRRKKKLRERNKKTRLREKAGASTGVDRSLNSESRKHVSAPADQEGQPKLSKRMKKRANWLAKHPKPEASIVTPAPAKSAREGKGSTSGREKVDGIRPQKSTLSKRGRVKSSKPLIDDDDLSDVDLPYKPIGASSYDDYEQEPEETYLGKRARKSSGKGGKLGKGRKANQSRGGSVHLSKKERKEKRDAKDATNADKVGKKMRGSKKDGKGGKGKGKGKRKGSVAVGTRKERRHKSKGRGKGKGGK